MHIYIYIYKFIVYLAVRELFKVASRAEMFIAEDIIDWVEVCCCLVVNICSGKYFCAAANSVISNIFALSKECYMHILRTRCILILPYGAGEWKCKNEQLRKLGILFNNTVRKLFS